MNQYFDDLDFALFVLMFCVLALCALLIIAHFASEAYLGWRLKKLAGSHRKALVALEEIEARQIDKRISRGMKDAVALQLVKR